MAKHTSPEPEPAWFRMFKRVEALLKRESIDDMCTALERVLASYEKDLVTAMLERRWTDVDHLSDEFAELGRFAPAPCPRIAMALSPEQIRRVVEALGR